MAQVTLTWINGNPPQTMSFSPPSRPGAERAGQLVPARIGRDPVRCTWVLSDPTVSGLHVELDYQPDRGFILRNLRTTNPPVVDGEVLHSGDRALGFGSQVQLGLAVLQVTALADDRAIAPTQLGPPIPAPPDPQYGLQCPSCQRLSSYDRAELGCPWCGTSLAGAVSVLLPSSPAEA